MSNEKKDEKDKTPKTNDVTTKNFDGDNPKTPPKKD